jgi:signal transduction histidine kinase
MGGALERIALALNSTLELREVLRALAGETLSLAGAGRTSLFLISDGALVPAASRAAHADDELWEAFQRMAPIPLTAERSALMALGQVLVVDDPAGICPPEWIERFDLHCLVMVPLLAGDVPCGLMTIDFPQSRRLDERELGLLQAIGSFAGVAVRNARTYEAARRTARLQAGLAEAAGALSFALPPDEVAGRLCAAATDLLGVRRSAVAMLNGRRRMVSPLLGRDHSSSTTISLDDVPERIQRRLDEAWRSGSGRACVFEGDAWLASMLGDDLDAAVVIVPLMIEGRAAGAAMLTLDPEDAHDAELRAVVEALAAIAGAALERHALVQRQQQQLDRRDILYGLSSALAERADARRLVDTLNVLLAHLGVEVAGMAFRARALVRHLGGDVPTTEEKAAWSVDAGPTLLHDGTFAVPMRLGRRLVGSLRVRAEDLDDDDLAFLEALAAGVAAVAHRGALRSSSEEASRERAVAAERDRIAADLHDTVGQQFVALGLMANRLVEHLPSGSPWAARVGRLAEMASGGKFEVDQAVRALAFVPAARRGLVPAVRGLCRLVGLDSGLDIVVSVTGRPVRLPATSERALYRVVHEALTNAWRHARCTTVAVQITFERETVGVTVRDDGVGLGVGDESIHTGNGLWSMRRTIGEVDGTVRVRNAKPRGAEVSATVPRGAR